MSATSSGPNCRSIGELSTCASPTSLTPPLRDSEDTPKTGAVGLGQLKPDTSSWVATVLLHDPSLDPSDPRDNLRMSARFLRYVLDTSGGDTARALAAYYQGPGSVRRDGITATGLSYASRILGARPSFR